MTSGWGHTRRAFLGSWLVSLVVKPWAWGAPGSTVAGTPTKAGSDPIGFSLRGWMPAASFQRRYRMDATILFLGAPLFTRSSAGGGYASVETSGDTEGTAQALQFAAGSLPARAHGLNRFGILREAVVQRGAEHSGGVENAFAGLMTRAREESFEQGRKALASLGHSAEGVIARGRTVGSTIQTWTDNIELAPDLNWSNLDVTLSDALRHPPQATPRESGAGPATFLHAMRIAALSRDAVLRQQFMHTSKLYWLETRRHPQRPLDLDGTIHRLNGERCAEFRTAYAAADESGIPIRIEYRPRSFLRLTFEADAQVTEPAIPSIFPSAFSEENA
jgi:hypothetical protein